MEFWLNFLPIVIYLLLIALLTIGIILGIKTIITMNKLEKVVDNVNEKVESLNSIFSIIDFTTDKIASFTDKVVEVTGNLFSKILFRKKERIREKNNMKKNGFGKFIAGAAVGAGLGLLFAPKTGKETREVLKKKFDEVLEQVKSIKAEDVKESIVKKVNELQKELKDLDKEKALKIAKQKATKIQKKADELYKLAVEKGTPVVEKSVSELKQATADALKKIVAKLEEEDKKTK